MHPLACKSRALAFSLSHFGAPHMPACTTSNALGHIIIALFLGRASPSCVDTNTLLSEPLCLLLWVQVPKSEA